MSTSLLEELELDTAVPEDDEKGVGGDNVPNGKYHARLVEAAETNAKDYTIDKMKFEILTGVHRGKLVPFDLFHTASTPEKTEKAKARRRSIYHRLGLLTKTEVNGQKKYSLAPGKSSIRDCLDTQVIIEVENEEETWADDKGRTRKAMKSKVSYFGVWKLDDPAVKDVPRLAGSAPPPAPRKAAEPEPDLAGI